MARKKADEKTEKKIDEKSVKKNVKKEELNLEKIKEELTDYMQSKIYKEVSTAIEKSNKKLVRHKN